MSSSESTGRVVVIKGGTVVDGTGAPRRRADISIRDGRILEIASQIQGGDEVIDASDLIVSPGFIDTHTHMECQLFWDKAATSAAWHGCTTVVMGNCGLSLAPVGMGDVDFAVSLMSSVEQIPTSVLASAVPFDWTSFGGFAESLQRSTPAVNAASFVGYSLVRRAVMGERAFGGVPTEEEADAIVELVRSSLAQGALGLSFNRATLDHDEHGRLMPGYDCTWEEVTRAARVVAEFPGTMLQAIPRWTSEADGWGGRNDDELAHWIDILQGVDRPLVWTAVSETRYENQMAATRRAREAGVELIAAIHGVPMHTYATLSVPGLFAATPGFDFLFDLSPEERLRAIQDEAVRERVRAATGRDTFSAYPLRYVSESGEVSLGHERVFPWDHIHHVGSAPERMKIGESIGERARREGRHPADVVLDEAAASELRDVFIVFTHANLPQVTLELLNDPATVISGNDTGAHLMLMAQADTTHLLDHFVRETGEVPLEQAVHLITGRQAQVFGIPERGVLKPGMAADITIFDPETIGAQAPEVVSDLPGGGPRYITRNIGIKRVIVNGQTLLIDGEPTGVTAGRFLKPAAPHP